MAVLLTASIGCAGEPAYEKPLTPVRAQPLERARPSSGVRYSASIEPALRVDLAFKAGGYIERLAMVGGRPIQDGDQVTRGTVLAQVRTADYVEKVNQARAMTTEAEAALAAAEAAFDRARRLYEARSLTRPELEQAQAARESLAARLAGARALVREAENAQSDTALVSPIDGVLLKRLVEVGSLVGPGVPGFVVADVRTVKAVFGAPDTVVRSLAIGASAPVTAEGVRGRQFQGRITKIAPAADLRGRVFDVELTLPNGDGALRVGMVASIVIGASATADEAGETFIVPLAAIVRSTVSPGQYAVFVIEETAGKTVTRMRTVALGDMVGSRIAVLSGLSEGDRVVVSGASIVADGETVSVVRLP